MKYRTASGPAEFAFARREDAIVQARAALDAEARDIELLENGEPLPRSEYAPSGRKPHARARRRRARA